MVLLLTQNFQGQDNIMAHFPAYQTKKPPVEVLSLCDFNLTPGLSSIEETSKINICDELLAWSQTREDFSFSSIAKQSFKNLKI